MAKVQQDNQSQQQQPQQQQPPQQHPQQPQHPQFPPMGQMPNIFGGMMGQPNIIIRTSSNQPNSADFNQIISSVQSLIGNYVDPNISVPPPNQPRPQPQQAPTQAPIQPPQQQQPVFVQQQNNPINAQRQVELPHQSLQKLGILTNQLMGYQAVFPGPPLPLPSNRNSLQLLGSFLGNYQFTMQRLLPFLYRLSELLQRENLMTQQQDRIATEQFARQIGYALEEVTNCSRIVAGMFQTINIGPNPGQFRMQDDQSQVINSQPVVQPPTQQQQPPIQEQQNNQQNTGNNQPQFNISYQEMGQGMDGNIAMIDIESTDDNPQNIGNLLQGIFGQLGVNNMNMFQPFQQQGPQQYPQQPPQPAQQPPQNQQIPQNPVNVTLNQQPQVFENAMEVEEQKVNQVQAPQQAPQQPPQMNPLAMMMNMGGGGGLGQIMGMTLQELMEQNYPNNMSESDETILKIFGPIKISDVIQAVLANNFTFLDDTHGQIKEGLSAQISDPESRERLKSSWIKEFCQMIEPVEEHKNKVIEGVQPEEIAKEILNQRLENLLKIIEQDYTGGEKKFSTEIVCELKQLIGEFIFEVSEGLVNGVDDFEIIFKHKLVLSMQQNFGPELAGMVQMLMLDNMWQNFKKMYLNYKNTQEKIESGEMERENQQQDELLQEIKDTAEKDRGEFERYQNIEFSEEYKKGNVDKFK